MRLNICMPDLLGDYKVLCVFETEHLGEEIAQELAEHAAHSLKNHPEVCFKDLILIKWEGDTTVIPRYEVGLEDFIEEL